METMWPQPLVGRGFAPRLKRKLFLFSAPVFHSTLSCKEALIWLRLGVKGPPRNSWLDPWGQQKSTHGKSAAVIDGFFERSGLGLPTDGSTRGSTLTSSGHLLAHNPWPSNWTFLLKVGGRGAFSHKKPLIRNDWIIVEWKCFNFVSVSSFTFKFWPFIDQFVYFSVLQLLNCFFP